LSLRNNTLVVSAVSVVAALVLGACGASSRHATTAGDPSHTQAPNPAPVRRPVTTLRARRAGRVITARASQYGSILTDGANRTVYLFTRDRSTASTCYGACAAAWPPVLTRGAPQREGDLKAVLGTTRRRNGSVQVTYRSHPLYYYVGDAKAGEILCQNVNEFGGTWLVVSPRGTPVR
jgi:predicted lipoprotein with Yx(FWY)xxD motif